MDDATFFMLTQHGEPGLGSCVSMLLGVAVAVFVYGLGRGLRHLFDALDRRRGTPIIEAEREWARRYGESSSK